MFLTEIFRIKLKGLRNMDNYGSDYLAQEAFDTKTVMKFLQWHGVEFTKFTLIRYANHGFVFEPRRKTGFRGYGRVYYCPLVPVEAMTAYYLQKGICASPEIGFKISQLTAKEVFIGRLLYYKKYFFDFESKPFEIYEYRTNFMDYLNKNKEEDSRDLHWTLEEGFYLFREMHEGISYKCMNGKFNWQTYFSYLEMVYRLTFEHILELCRDEIMEIYYGGIGASKRL